MAKYPTCGLPKRWRTTEEILQDYPIGRTKLYDLRKPHPEISRKPFGRRLWDAHLLERLIERQMISAKAD